MIRESDSRTVVVKIPDYRTVALKSLPNCNNVIVIHTEVRVFGTLVRVGKEQRMREQEEQGE